MQPRYDASRECDVIDVRESSGGAPRALVPRSLVALQECDDVTVTVDLLQHLALSDRVSGRGTGAVKHQRERAIG